MLFDHSVFVLFHQIGDVLNDFILLFNDLNCIIYHKSVMNIVAIISNMINV